MVFHDEMGNRIHAVVKRPQLAMFVSKTKEGHVYAIKNFIVRDNYQLYKTTSHLYLLEFVTKMKVFQQTHDFPSFLYDFQLFDMLQAQRLLDDKLLIDVIGKVISRCAPQSHVINNKTERLMEVTLEDADGNRIGCTLWNNYIKQFNDYVDNAQNEQIFMIVQLCRPKPYKGNVVSTSFDVTKLIINGDRIEFEDFKNLFNEDA
ncbi:unnamed protein product [Cuscuta europaea]|uniref:Replication protein A 70 kDa DNA-binding subunit B/D first OB fold domain-containing protein n=1 Tax=Cuscuta europaea TaxID=41803 RepID=A0A9P0YY33_CUSEU|nr:unnamed protein product [Cuscuta europaea]